MSKICSFWSVFSPREHKGERGCELPRIGKSGDRGGKAGIREAGKIVWGQVEKSFECLAKGWDSV